MNCDYNSWNLVRFLIWLWSWPCMKIHKISNAWSAKLVPEETAAKKRPLQCQGASGRSEGRQGCAISSPLTWAPRPTTTYQADSLSLNGALPHFPPLIALCSFSSRALIFVCDNIFICICWISFFWLLSPSKARCWFTTSLLYAQHLE